MIARSALSKAERSPTRNIKDFEGLDLPLVNPFESAEYETWISTMPLRIIFMGTPDFSVPVLRALHAGGA